MLHRRQRDLLRLKVVLEDLARHKVAPHETECSPRAAHTAATNIVPLQTHVVGGEPPSEGWTSACVALVLGHWSERLRDFRQRSV